MRPFIWVGNYILNGFFVRQVYAVFKLSHEIQVHIFLSSDLVFRFLLQLFYRCMHNTNAFQKSGIEISRTEQKGEAGNIY